MKDYKNQNKEEDNLELEIIISDIDSELIYRLNQIITTQKLLK